MAYGLVGIIVAVINVVTVNSLGANDPRYAALAKQFASAIPSDARVFSNSFHLLDIHARRASISVDTSPTPGGPNDYFLWVTLPQYDGIASSVSVMPRPSAGWCELQSSDAATLFRACP
jgi:hypothetical protein